MLNTGMDSTINLLVAPANCAVLHPLDSFDLPEV